ncbi:TetR/AcrR family transcriptional regulator [Arthrobacter tecti]
MRQIQDKQEVFAASALDLIVRGGIQAVSVRTVAADAGWSVGALQKTFPNKEALLRAAVKLLVSKVETRMDAIAFTGEAVDYLVRLVQETLPVNRLRREEALAWNAFTTEATHTPWLAEMLVAQDQRITGQLIEALGASGASHPEMAAAGIIAVSDGFATRLLYDPDRADELCAALEPIINHLLAL